MKLIANCLLGIDMLFLMAIVAALDYGAFSAATLVECMLLGLVLGVLLAYYIDLLEFEEKKRRKRCFHLAYQEKAPNREPGS